MIGATHWYRIGSRSLAGEALKRIYQSERGEAVVLLVAIAPLFGMDAFLYGRTQTPSGTGRRDR